jgi:hypothetical protein
METADLVKDRIRVVERLKTVSSIPGQASFSTLEIGGKV